MQEISNPFKIENNVYVEIDICFCISVAMGRCRSTPGLVESKGKTRIEDMVVTGGPIQSAADPNSSAATLFDAANNDGASTHAEHPSSSSSNTHYGELISGIPMETMHATEKPPESQKYARRQSADPMFATNTGAQRWPAPKAGGMKPTPSYQSLHSGKINNHVQTGSSQ